MGPEAPERVLVRPQLPEVEPVAVDVAKLAELTRVHDLLQREHARVVLEQVPDHQQPPRLGGGRNRQLRVGDRLRKRLLDEAVLARLEHPGGERRVRRHRRREHDRVERGVAQQLIEVAGEARRGKLAGEALASLRVGVAAPGQLALGKRGEVAREVRPPVAEAHHSHAHARAVH